MVGRVKQRASESTQHFQSLNAKMHPQVLVLYSSQELGGSTRDSWVVLDHVSK